MAWLLDFAFRLLVPDQKMTPKETMELRTDIVPDDAREPSLIVRILAGEPELYHDLIHLHEESVDFVAFSMLQDPGEGEEVAQESALKGFRNLAQFRAESHFST